MSFSVASAGDQSIDETLSPQEAEGIRISIDGSFAYGNGTEEDPYMIEDVYQLQNMSNDLSAHYALANDIDASVTMEWNWNGTGYEGFVPIGDSDYTFTGTFDGRNQTIIGLHINRSSIYFAYVSLFGYVDYGSEVRNIGMVDVYIIGHSNRYVGGLVGENRGNIYNSYATGNVSGGGWLGGLVGRNFGGIIDSYAGGEVKGNIAVGGLVGHNFGGTVENSYASVDVTIWNSLFPSRSLGGLVGENNWGGTVLNSYSEGDVYAGESSEGLPITAVGGLVGSNAGLLSNSYYNIDTVLVNNVHHVTLGGLYNEQYNDWIANDLSLDISDYSDTLVPTGDSYIISDIQGFRDLLGFSGDGYTFILDSNLDLSSSPGHYIPSFNGIFDGNNHTISHLYINQPFSLNVGLFGSLFPGSQVVNVGLVDVNVTGYWIVGGLVGFKRNSVIDNSYTSGEVKGYGNIGGLVGYIRDGFVNNSYTTGKIGTIEVDYAGPMIVRYAGGLVGYNYDSTISTSYSSCDLNIYREFYIGGLVGHNRGGLITDSFTTGNVSSAYAGGLVGENAGTVEHSYATGTVDGAARVGGLVGLNIHAVVFSFATGNVSGFTYAGGLVGENRGMMVHSYATGTVNGGDIVGGLVGYNNGGMVANSHSTGDVSGEWGVGGLVGFMGGSISLVANSYPTGNVRGQEAVGGLVGSNGIDSKIPITGGTVIDSYSRGNITRITDSSGSRLGGFLGFNYRGKIINCYSTGGVQYEDASDPTDKGFAGSVDTGGDYEMTGNFWDVENSGQISTAGNATGKTTTEMMVIGTFNAAGWNITDVDSTNDRDTDFIWNIVESETYPFFSWRGYTLEVHIMGNGTVDSTPRGYIHSCGTEVTLTAVPDMGWYFSHWSGDVPEGEEESDEITVEMDGDKTVTAHFVRHDFSLNITVDGEGTTDPEPGYYIHEYNDEVTVIAIPSYGWWFSHWSGDVPEGEEESDEITVEMDGDKTVTAHFVRHDFSLNITVDGEGTTDPEPGYYIHEYNDEVTVIAIPSYGWRFSHWSGDVPEGEEYYDVITIMMDEDKALTAHFERREFSLNITMEGEGITDPSSGTHTYLYEDEVTITAIPSYGWRFSHWTGDVSSGLEENETISIFMDGDKTVVAHFERQEFSLNISVEGDGTTSPSVGVHPYLYEYGATVTAMPAEGWRFNHWSGDIESTDETFTIFMDGNKNITAHFEELLFIPDDLVLIVTPVEGESPLNVTITVRGDNVGLLNGSVDVMVDDIVTHTLLIPAGERAEHTFNHTFQEQGNYTISFDNLSETVIVSEPDEVKPSSIEDNFTSLLIIAMIAVVILLVLFKKRLSKTASQDIQESAPEDEVLSVEDEIHPEDDTDL